MNSKFVYRTGAIALTVSVAVLLMSTLLAQAAAPLTPIDRVRPQSAAADVLYVDGATGTDGVACGTTVDPCQTISYTVNSRATNTETIRVAQGVYTENLAINLPVTLEGGYESTGWTRDIHQYETIIDGSGSQTTPGDWDGRRVAKAGVISDSTEYKLWYDGADLNNHVQIGLATSADGLTWVKDGSNPVITGTPGVWDQFGEHDPFVLKESGVYKMWYEGGDTGVRQVYYATSTNAIDWNKYPGNPVISIGSPGSFDAEAAAHVSVLNDGTYKLWYHAQGSNGPIIAYATSADGISWTKQGPALEPVPGWDQGGVWGSSVIKIGSLYWMWYSGGGPSGAAIGVVTSTNGSTWTRFTSTPVLSSSSNIGDPEVISDSGKLMMWYTNYDQRDILYAESVDGLAWTPSVSNPVLTPGTLAATWGKPVVTINSADVTLDGFTITGGDAEQVGGIEANTNTVIRNCLIENNQARGVGMAWGAGGVLDSEPLSIINTRIVNNSANDGASGVRAGQTQLLMTNTLVADNQATNGAPGVHLNGDATIVNSTIVFNSNAGVLFNSPGGYYLTLTNTIIYNNDNSIVNPGAGTASVAYSDIQGSWAGTGNIDEDPQFVDPSSGDYRLTLPSPAVDTGTDVGAPSTDVAGNSRPLDGDADGVAITDMGAYELVLYQINLPIVLKNYSN